ncbi:MAG TPA: hypothetical protein VF434_11380, partial [Promineifilum sp.]
MSSDSELGSSGSGVRPRHILPLAALLALLVAFFGLRGTVLAVPVMVVDDAGADDEPGQKDLSFLTIDYAPVTPGTIDVSWGWDDTVKSGANTSDACTLFDTDMDGDANYSLCITADGSPLTFLSIRLYACTADNRTDRCAGPSEITTFSSTGTASVVPGSDPFGTTGRAGNDCDADPACLSDDTVATAQVVLSDFGGGSAKLLNICSYPSREPNSDPSDCVITPDSGFLTIVKVADPDDTTQFTFNLGVGQSSQDGSTSWIIEGSGSQSLISFEADTGYDLSEVIPAGWDLTSAACEIQTAPPTLTGTQTATGVDDFEIQSGLETICTFNDVQDASLTLAKLVTNDNGGTAAAADWTLTAAGPSGFSGPGPSVSSPAGFSAGTYDLSESGPGGYTASDWVCAGGTQNDSDTITLAPGESATCTITNDDDAPSLTLVKAI